MREGFQLWMVILAQIILGLGIGWSLVQPQRPNKQEVFKGEHGVKLKLYRRPFGWRRRSVMWIQSVYCIIVHLTTSAMIMANICGGGFIYERIPEHLSNASVQLSFLTAGASLVVCLIAATGLATTYHLHKLWIKWRWRRNNRLMARCVDCFRQDYAEKIQAEKDAEAAAWAAAQREQLAKGVLLTDGFIGHDQRANIVLLSAKKLSRRRIRQRICKWKAQVGQKWRSFRKLFKRKDHMSIPESTASRYRRAADE